ncbi:MAG: hypothetical protein AAFO69_14260, partial [Bacteroidota bacterium]
MNYTDEQILAYLSGDFSASEEQDFGRLLQEDQQLMERVRLFREMDEFLVDDDWSLTDPKGGSSLSDQYQDFLNGEEGKSYFKAIKGGQRMYFDEQPKGKQVFGQFSRLAIAASVLILAITALFWMIREPSGAELYAQYYDTSPLPSLTSRTGDTALNEYSELIASEQNEAALSWLDSYMDGLAEPVNPQLYLHKGMLELKLDKVDLAIQTFSQLRDGQSLDAEKAFWYLALA